VIGRCYECVLALVGFLVRDLFLAGRLISVASACARCGCGAGSWAGS